MPGRNKIKKVKTSIPSQNNLVSIATDQVSAIDNIVYAIKDSYLMLLASDKEADDFIDGINNIVKNDGILDSVVKFFNKVDTLEKSLSSLKSKNVNKLSSFFKGMINIFSPLQTLSGGDFKKSVDDMSSIFDLLSSISDGFAKVAGNLINLTVGKAKMKLQIKYLMSTVKYILNELSFLYENSKNINGDDLNILNNKIENSITTINHIKSLTISILTLGTLIPLLMITTPIVISGIYVLNNLILVINKIFTSSKNTTVINDIKNITLCITGITAMLLGFTIMTRFADNILISIPIALLMMVALIPVLWVMKKLLNYISSLSDVNGGSSLKTVKSLNLIFIGLSVLCLSIWVFSKLNVLLFTSAPIVLIMLGALYIIFLTIYKFFALTRPITGRKSLTRFATLGLIFVMLGGIVMGLVYFAALGAVMLSVYDIIILTMIGLVGVVLAIGGIGWIISKMWKVLTKAAGGIVIMLIFMGALYGMVEMLDHISLQAAAINDRFWDTLLLLGNITVTVAAITGIGFLAITALPIMGPALIGLGLITLSIGAICLIAMGLEYLQKFELDKEKLKESLSTIKDAIFSINNMLFAESDAKKDENSGFFQKIVDAVVPAFSGIFRAIATVGYLAASLASIWMLKLLANQLKEIQDIKINKEKLTANITDILSSAQLCIDAINQPGDIENKPKKKGLSSLLSWVSDKFSAVADYMSMMGKLSTYMIAIGMIHSLGKYMQEINDVKLDNVTTRVDDIIKVASSITKNVLSEDNMKIKNFRDANKRIDLLERVGEVVADFADVSNNDVKRSEALINNYVKFIDKINTSDLTNLKTTVELFQRMTEFSKSIAGDFDKLADALQEKIAPLLEKLEGHVSKMKMDVSTGIDLSRMNNQALTATAAANGVHIDSATTEKEIEDQKEIAYDNSLQNAEIPDLLQEIIEILHQRR